MRATSIISTPRAFFSEVEPTSRRENATIQRDRALSVSVESENALGRRRCDSDAKTRQDTKVEPISAPIAWKSALVDPIGSSPHDRQRIALPLRRSWPGSQKSVAGPQSLDVARDVLSAAPVDFAERAKRATPVRTGSHLSAATRTRVRGLRGRRKGRSRGSARRRTG
jgi:hypothetical protein